MRVVSTGFGLAHSTNSRLVVVYRDGGYIIYSVRNLRYKLFGTLDEVVWDNRAGEFAINLGFSSITVCGKTLK